MVIRIYVEGGGDGKDTKAEVRQGFKCFLGKVVPANRFQVIACGRRNATFDAFCTAVQTHTAAFNMLLVDSEGPVTLSPWSHLRARDRWQTPVADEDHCHLMVQATEAWLLADQEALADFYGQGFTPGSLPGNPNVEEIEKQRVLDSLAAATRHTQKGPYEKIRHGPKLLARLDASKVRRAAVHCDRLFTTLAAKMEATL